MSAQERPPTLTHLIRGARVSADSETRASEKRQWFEAEPLWFKRAVLYEVYIRAFFDANGDGSGDFRGLTEKLDYLQWLGIDCIWLLPFYASPFRDAGFDISDFTSVHPDYGTVGDVGELIDAAHARRLRVIADVVMNHTSIDHPWFQESRSSPDSPKRDWYVWSANDERYAEARVLFTDTESSNWTWDSVAGAYYWHRFYSHEPDLNYDNPEVQEAMLGVLRFWLELGLDGFRLEGVPYLFEREGTNCEDLPETRTFISNLAEAVKAEYADRVLLLDAQLWTPDATDYGSPAKNVLLRHVSFPAGLFSTLITEERATLFELVRRPLSENSAPLALFLRDHGELRLDAVVDAVRARARTGFGMDPFFRLRSGTRRRLASIMDTDRSALELAFTLLMTLPGSPIIYYGDEIGMGENHYLEGCAGLRTPMQWTGDRNGGFSRADWGRLYERPLVDPVYGFEALNVEQQLRTAGSFLRLLHRLIAFRQTLPALAYGNFLPLYPPNASIVAFVRGADDEVEPVLVLANLSQTPQVADLDLSPWELRIPVELFGRRAFPPIGGRLYRLTLTGRGSLLLGLSKPVSPGATEPSDIIGDQPGR